VVSLIEQMDGRVMKTFVAVLEEKSFSKAAVRLGYVQSTVTAHIKQMEGMAGKQLFRRMPRGVEPTEVGLEVAPFAYHFLKLGVSLQEALSELDEPKGTVSMRALESFCVPFLPQLLITFFKEFPLIQLRLETGFQADIIEEVVSYRADFGIVPRDPEHSDLEFLPLVKDELLWVASPAMAGLNLEAQIQQVIGFGNRCIYQAYAHDLLREKGTSPLSTLDFNSLEMVKQTVHCGMGLAMLPRSAVKAELESCQLVALPYESPVPLQHGLIQVKGRELSTASQIWKNSLIAHFHS
jgi:DNA-binding transcriptional LysR family regulator